MMLSAAEMAFALVAGHALADYPLQGDYLAQAKNRNVPMGANGIWVWALGSHAFIQGGVVAVITGIWWLGALEVIAHAAIDFLKCERHITFSADQVMHLLCKAVWLSVVFWGVTP